jgi:hypothetical protein
LQVSPLIPAKFWGQGGGCFSSCPVPKFSYLNEILVLNQTWNGIPCLSWSKFSSITGLSIGDPHPSSEIWLCGVETTETLVICQYSYKALSALKTIVYKKHLTQNLTSTWIDSCIWSKYCIYCILTGFFAMGFFPPLLMCVTHTNSTMHMYFNSNLTTNSTGFILTECYKNHWYYCKCLVT